MHTACKKYIDLPARAVQYPPMSDKELTIQAVEQAIEAAGGPQGFMADLAIGERTLYHLRSGDRLHPARVLQIEQLYGIPRHILRPDLWEAPTGRRVAP